MAMAFTEEQVQANKARFIELINSIEREGTRKEALIAKLDFKAKPNDLNFFDAPASTKYHLDCKGGLCAHCLNVYDMMVNLVKVFRMEDQISSDSIKIVALLHDFSKLNMYETTIRARKAYYEGGSKFDDGGAYDWVNEKSYKVKEYEDRFLYGTHEETSVYMVKFFITLTLPEEIAILHHMSGCDKLLTYNERSDESAVATRFPLLTLLHAADYLSTFILENDTAVKLMAPIETETEETEEVSEEVTEPTDEQNN